MISKEKIQKAILNWPMVFHRSPNPPGYWQCDWWLFRNWPKTLLPKTLHAMSWNMGKSNWYSTGNCTPTDWLSYSYRVLCILPEVQGHPTMSPKKYNHKLSDKICPPVSTDSGVAKYSLSECIWGSLQEMDRIAGTANGAQTCDLIGPRGEPDTIILPNRYSVKTTPS